MAQDTNLSRNPNLGLPSKSAASDGKIGAPSGQGVRTYVLLVVAMALVIAVVTGLSLLLIRQHLRTQVTDDLSADLQHSVVTFQNLEAERLLALDRENALLAQLPTLKALMTSPDDLTIQDGAAEFWHLSGTDLFLLADPAGRVRAAYLDTSASPDDALRQGLKILIASPDKHYLIERGSLYACAVRPLSFGSDQEGTLLGFVMSCVSTDRIVRQISHPSGAEATFLSQGAIVASTLPSPVQASLARESAVLSKPADQPATITLGGIRYLSATEDLSSVATSPLQLVVLRSLASAELSISRINRMVLIVGLLALLSGTVLMMIISRVVTRPLEELSRSVRAFGLGDKTHDVPGHGTQEVRELSASFESMRNEIENANAKVLESERLATIGRMASSVSHDLRHYLAAIYANSEFLASDRLSSKERAEILDDIRTAVTGTTDMIESLLIFSRTGSAIRRQPELMAAIVEKATALVRAHPDAEGVTLSTSYGDPTETAVIVDAKQIERAISNLLLNACQSVRPMGSAARVDVTVETLDTHILVNVVDNGPGVPEKIRTTLFEPFVSEGKQKGTGLGLTLAWCIVAEHGGELALLRSGPGETVFQMRVAREVLVERPEPEPQAQVMPDENVRT
jgi:signal transduction histidine kinase